MTNSSIAVITALIAAFTSLLVAVVTAALGYRYQRRSDYRMARLTEVQKERDAQRDYSYEARKRLYADLQPVFFQLAELSESAFRHILALARTARQGNLGDHKDSWWHDSYFLNSTVYRFLAPLVLVRLCQRRLTFVDVSVDPSIGKQYALAKGVLLSWNSGFDLAAADPAVPYDPHNPKADQLVKADPAKYELQHLYSGQVDRIIAILTTTVADGSVRPTTYGEFEDALGRTSDTQRYLAPAVALFQTFHPMTSPVVWRLLVVHAHLYKAFMRSFSEPIGSVVSSIDVLSDEEKSLLDWREPGASIASSTALDAPLLAARAYLKHAGLGVDAAKLRPLW